MRTLKTRPESGPKVAKTELHVSPEAYRAILKEKGWSIAGLARRLGIGRVWMTRCIDNPDRATVYTEALWALPVMRNLGRVQAYRAATLARVSRSGEASEQAAPSSPLGPGFRYQPYMPIGAVVQATADVGSMAEEGMRGIVFHHLAIEDGEAYGIIFENGEFDWFRPDDVDASLATIGIEREALAGYVYRSKEDLAVDYSSGAFEFW